MLKAKIHRAGTSRGFLQRDPLPATGRRCASCVISIAIAGMEIRAKCFFLSSLCRKRVRIGVFHFSGGYGNAGLSTAKSVVTSASSRSEKKNKYILKIPLFLSSAMNHGNRMPPENLDRIVVFAEHSRKCSPAFFRSYGGIPQRTLWRFAEEADCANHAKNDFCGERNLNKRKSMAERRGFEPLNE